MDSLANYGSDDDYDDNSSDKMGTYKSGASQPWQHASATTQADVNYDEVQMDLSEDSNNNNSNDDSPRHLRAADRRRSYRSRSRDDVRVRSQEHRSNRKDQDDRTRKHAKYDHERAKYDQNRAKYDREAAHGYENRPDKAKCDRESSQSHENRPDRSKYDRQGQNSHEERPKHAVEERQDKSRHGKDEKSNRNRTRKFRSGSKERRRSGSKERRRSTSRERKRSRSPRRNEYRNSKERDRTANTRNYGKRFDRTSNKMAQLEKLGIEIKTPDSEFVTPQMLLQRSMDEQVQKVKHTTGIELPKYYNPAAMNPARYADQIQKRRLLWQKKDAAPSLPAAVQPQRAAAQQPGTGKVWEQTTFAQDQDGKVASKFKRLMGIRDTPATVTGPTGGREILKKQEEMFSSMEQQYEVARTATHTMRGVGLGFGTFQSYPR